MISSKSIIKTAVHVAFAIYLTCLFSCKTQQQIQYLTGKFDTAQLSKLKIPELLIQKGDLIGIALILQCLRERQQFFQSCKHACARVPRKIKSTALY